MSNKSNLATGSVMIWLLSFLLISPLWHIPPVQADRVTLTVVQYNIHYGKGTDEVYDRQRQVNLMLSQEPDLISLNEVLPGEALAYKSLLENSSGITWHSYHIAASLQDGAGNQILSKHPIRSASSYIMSTNGEYRRAVAQATVEVNGGIVNFFSTHLDHNNDEVRAAQVEEMKAFMAGFAEPRIIAGDFNALWDSGEMTSFSTDYLDSWTEAISAGTATAYPDNPVGPNTLTTTIRKDYIFYSKDADGSMTLSAAIPDQRNLSNTNVRKKDGTTNDYGVRPSDHNLVTAVLKVRAMDYMPPPVISGVEMSGKRLIVMGENFSPGAKILLNGTAEKTRYTSAARLTGKKAGGKVRPGDTLRVRNPDGSLSPPFTFR